MSRPAAGGGRAFVLSGGGSLGAVQVGMLQALVERGTTPDLLVGSSAGALNAAFLCSRPGPAGVAELGDVWRGLSGRRLFPVRPLTVLRGLLGAGTSLFPDRGLKDAVRAHLQVQRLEQAPVSLTVVATDLVDGTEAVLRTGDALSAVLASAAIPGIYPVVRREGRALVDGGVADNTPVSQALARGADEVWVLPTGHACGRTAPPRGALGVALQAVTLLVGERLARELEALPDADASRVHVLPPPCPHGIPAGDFSRADALIAAAYLAAREFLDAVGGQDTAGMTAEAVRRLRPHRHSSARPALT